MPLLLAEGCIASRAVMDAIDADDALGNAEALAWRASNEHPSLTIGELRNKRAVLKMHSE